MARRPSKTGETGDGGKKGERTGPRPDDVRRAKRLEAKLAHWLKADPTHADELAKDPARVLRRLAPAETRNAKVDETAARELAWVLASRTPSAVDVTANLFVAWWNWLASPGHLAAFQQNPVGTVATAGVGFPEADVQRLMNAVALVTGASSLPAPLPGATLAIAAHATKADTIGRVRLGRQAPERGRR